MNIGIIGAGNVGGTLGKAWAAAGHQIKFGLRNITKPEVVSLLKAIGPGASAGTVAEAAAFGEVVVLTTPWNAVQPAIVSAGKLAGKIVIDATNPLELGAEGLKRGLLVGHTTSAAEQVAQWATGAHVVKCFNTTGAGNMARPNYNGQKLTMFLCGDDANAKKIVASLAEQIGFAPADAGQLSSARLLEPLAMLWIHFAFAQGWGMDFGLTVVRR